MLDLRSQVVGAGEPAPTLDGRTQPYVNLDNAASTPALRAALDAVERLLPWYSGVHRGTGYKARVSTEAYEEARRVVGALRRGRPGPRRRRVHQEHHRGDQPAGPLAGPPARRRGAHHHARTPLQRPAVAGAGPHGPRRRPARRDARRGRPRPAAHALRRAGRAARRHRAPPTSRGSSRRSTGWRPGCTRPAAASWSTPPSSPPTGPSTCAPTATRGTSTSSPSRPTSSTPRSARAP